MKTLAPIEQLPTELLDRIVDLAIPPPSGTKWFSYIYDWRTPQTPIRDLCRVSKIFYHSARPLLYRQLVMDYGLTPRGPSKIASRHEQSILDNPQLGKHCRLLDMNAFSSKHSPTDANTKMLQSFTAVQNLVADLNQGMNPHTLMQDIAASLPLLKRVRVSNFDANFIYTIVSTLQQMKHLKEVHLVHNDIAFKRSEIRKVCQLLAAKYGSQMSISNQLQILELKNAGQCQALALSCSLSSLRSMMSIVQWPRQLSSLNLELSGSGLPNEGFKNTHVDMDEFKEEADLFRKLLRYHRTTLKTLAVTSRISWKWPDVLQLADFPELENLHLEIRGPTLFSMTPADACDSIFHAPKLQFFAWSICKRGPMKPEHALWILETLILVCERGLALRRVEIDVDYCYPFVKSWKSMVKTLSKTAKFMGIDVVLVPTANCSPYIFMLPGPPLEDMDWESEDSDVEMD